MFRQRAVDSTCATEIRQQRQYQELLLQSVIKEAQLLNRLTIPCRGHTLYYFVFMLYVSRMTNQSPMFTIVQSIFV